MSDDILLLGLAEQARRVAAGDLSPRELLRATRERIAAVNPAVNAMVTLSDTAMDQARDLEAQLAAGREPGPLAGVPVGIKDVTPVRGLRLTHGSLLHRDDVATVDAVVVQRLRDAGAIIVGKTNTPEFAAGGNTVNEVFGATCNPWDRERSAGGSTGGGAAALATGMVALAEGTDLGGSLRIPAACCGVVGLRPTPGLVPTWPSEYAWDTLRATGFMARRAEDIALVLDAVAGPSPMTPIGQAVDFREFSEVVSSRPGAGMRVGYCPDVAAMGIDPAIASACRDALDALADAGAAVEEVEFDLSYAREAFVALRGYWMAVQHRHRLDQLDSLGPDLRGNIEAGLRVEPRTLADAEAARGRMWAEFRGYFKSFDYLLTPTMAVSPFPLDQRFPETVGGKPMATYVDWMAPTFLLSLSGLPVASVPVGLDPEGLPLGLQVVAPPGGEGAALACAARLQELRPIGAPNLV